MIRSTGEELASNPMDKMNGLMAIRFADLTGISETKSQGHKQLGNESLVLMTTF